jgi:hypothetical protein
MVVIQIKNGEKDTFLYETTGEKIGDFVIRDLCEIYNMRVRLKQLIGGLGELSRHGPMKPQDKVGLDEILEQNGEVIEKGQYYDADPTGSRTGSGVGPQLSATMEKVCADADAILSPANVQRKVAISMDILQEKLDNMRGSVMMAYPMGLPEWDTVRLTIESCDGLDGTQAGNDLLDANTVELWIASRMLERSQTVAERFGRNEKTKVVAKLQKPGAGPPGREAAVSEDEKKAMMAYYFKKQEELKSMAESSEDDYLHSSWADPKALQRSLQGQTSIKAPGLRL